ncbi:sigma-70 family RNA polymerase sigma factor [Brucella sp. 21LCYQ03]|nr:sigma-70 family RNA polymerase sigma factor [Brucella sp. 21LCYQ03]
MRTSNRATAEDVVQDAWLKLEAAEASTPVDNIGGYLSRVVNNAITDHFRKERRRSQIDQELSDILWESIDTISPEQVMIDRENLALLCNALDELPKKTREIFLLNRMQGVPHRKIAEQMGISDNAVYYHIRRALEHLAKFRDEFND